MIVQLPFDLMSKSIKVFVPHDRVNLVSPRKLKSVDIKQAVISALNHPEVNRVWSVGKKASSIAVLIDDHTRPTPTSEVLEYIIDEINSKADITLIYARGTHDLPPLEYVKSKVGLKASKRCNLVIHDAYDDEAHRFIGVTRYGTPVWVNKEFLNAEFKIGIGSIFPSEIAGFTGGYKIVVPGIAHYNTIDCNHRMFISPKAEVGRVRDNPVRLDIDEAGRLSGLNLAIDFILNPDNGVVRCFAGDPLKEHREGVNLCRRMYRFKVDGNYDLVVASPGATEDIDFVQSIKAIFTSYRACKPGGKILLVASCRLGHQWPELIEFAERVRRKGMGRDEVLREVLKGNVESFTGAVMYRLYDIFIAGKYRLYMYTNGLDDRVQEVLNIKLVEDPQEVIDETLNSSNTRILVMPYAALTYLEASS